MELNRGTKWLEQFHFLVPIHFLTYKLLHNPQSEHFTTAESLVQKMKVQCEVNSFIVRNIQSQS